MKEKISKELKNAMDGMLKEIEKMKSEAQQIEDLEKRIRRLEFTMEMACDDLNEVSHMMGFMEKHLELENLQLSKCISLMHATVSKVEVDLLEEISYEYPL